MQTADADASAVQLSGDPGASAAEDGHPHAGDALAVHAEHAGSAASTGR